MYISFMTKIFNEAEIVLGAKSVKFILIIQKLVNLFQVI